MLLWDTGLGKSVAALALSKLSFDFGDIDHVLLVCERNKLAEWVADFQAETGLGVRKHHGASRWKQMDAQGLPQVLITTYETAKLDGVVKEGPRKLGPGRLLTALEGLRVLVVYDEVAKLSNRSSATYKAHEHMLKILRKKAPTMVLGLTGTPIEKGWEDAFNQMRLIAPEEVWPVTEFTKRCIRYRDVYRRPVYDTVQVREFADLVRPRIGRKRKTDPDVIEQFPPFTEEYRYIELSAPHREFYKVVEEEIAERDRMGDLMTLRVAASFPGALAWADGKTESEFAQQIITMVGKDHLCGMPCLKEDEVSKLIRTVVMEQGRKMMLFTYFGQTVLPYLAMLIEQVWDKKIPLFTYHGGQSGSINEQNKERFRKDEGGAILLGSDAMARGINVPEATTVVELESALTHAQRVQRLNRAHRMRSDFGPVSALTLIAKDTIEEPIFENVLKRNEMHDAFTGDDVSGEEYISAATRRELLAVARARHRSKR